MAIHEYPATPRTNVPQLRVSHPDASIIRRHPDGRCTVFDRTGDAVGHWSADRIAPVSA